MNAKERMLKYLDSKDISQYSFSKETGLSNGFLKSGSSISSENMELISNIYIDLNLIWLITGKGEMLKAETDKSKHILSEISKQETETRPRIPMDAAAGSLSTALDGVTVTDCEQIPVIKTFPKYDFTIVTRGDSMYPEYHSGDELACLYVRESSFLQWGRVHVLDTAQGVILKRIFNKGDHILCKSINVEYEEFTIPKSDVYNIALVIGLVRGY